MGIGINYETNSADFLPIIKYDARAGRLSRVDRVNGESIPTDITSTFKAVFDLENLETGWIDFEGGAPQYVLTRLGSGPKPEQPGETYREGVRCLVKLGKDIGGDVREISSTAKAFLRGFDKLHDDYKAAAAENPGKLPVVELSRAAPHTTGEGARKSTNYVPEFRIISWVTRPADLVYKARGSSTKTTPAPSTPPSTGSTKVAPPPAGDADLGW
jgi:hypothetical protein